MSSEYKVFGRGGNFLREQELSGGGELDPYTLEDFRPASGKDSDRVQVSRDGARSKMNRVYKLYNPED